MKSFSVSLAVAGLLGLTSAAQLAQGSESLEFMPPRQEGNEWGYAEWLDKFCELSYKEQEMARQAILSKKVGGARKIADAAALGY